MDDKRRDRIRQRVLETRRAQGLPDKIEDPAIMAKVVDLLGAQGVDR